MQPINFNLLDEPWIPVLYADGRFEHVGIRKALTEAHAIRQMAASNPMDQFAVHRFLITLLYWKSEEAGGVSALRKLLLDGPVPSIVLDAIDAESCCFELIDDTAPFLQDPSVQNSEVKSVGYLFAEFASGTNIAHFHHGDDKNMRLCLRCAAIGLLRVIPWSQSGGAGLTPAVHGAPPIMTIAIGGNLAVTLGLNLLPLSGRAGTPTWSGHFVPRDKSLPIPYLEAFTWNPRRIHLRAPERVALCWRCGESDVMGVGPIVFTKNEATKKRSDKEPFNWVDPSAFYMPDKPFMPIKSYDEGRAVNGQDLAWLLNGTKVDCSVVSANANHEGWWLVVPCTNPANNKSFDHRHRELLALSPEAIRDHVPRSQERWMQRAIDGWNRPVDEPSKGSKEFVRRAAELLTQGDWAVLDSAAYLRMDQSPAGFDLLVGLLWPMRPRRGRGGIPGLPQRNAAWLVLKTMAAAPMRGRNFHPQARFCPLDALPRRQLARPESRAEPSLYPRSLPTGGRLEAELRSTVHRHFKNRAPEPVNWVALCHSLNRLLN